VDVSFKLNHRLGETLSGADISDTTNGTKESINASAGGEFQYQPLVARGGSDVEPCRWSIGLLIYNPDGWDSGATPAPELIRPAFLWWSRVNDLLFAFVGDYIVRPGFTYHFTIQIDDTGGGSSDFLVNGSSISKLAGTSDMPELVAISSAGDSKFALYIAKAIGRSTGKWDEAAFMRGLYDLTATGGNVGGTTITTTASIPASNWDSTYYFVRSRDSNNEGEIRRVSSIAVGAPSTITVADAFSAQWANDDTFDLIPCMEHVSQDVTIQELRIWNSFQTSAVITALLGRQILRDIRSTLPEFNQGYLEGATEANLVGYYSLADDGGGVIEDRTTLKNHGWFSSWAGPYEADPSLFLDGERISVQMDLADEPALRGAWRHNLGADGELNIHMRAVVQIARDLADNGEANIEDCLYETIFEWGDPTQQEPLFSLRRTVHSGANKFYLVWHDGSGSNIVTIPNAISASPSVTEYALGIRPVSGRVYSLIAGIQRLDANHRYYVMITDGSTTAKGYSNIISSPTISLIDFGKSRVSFGASVYGEQTKGAGLANAMLGRIWEAAWSLRPLFDQRAAPDGPASENSEMPLDRWTSSDRLVPGKDVEVEISRENTVMGLTRASKAVTSPAGRNWASEYSDFPAKYMLVVAAIEERRLEEDRSPKVRPPFIHLDTLTLTAGELSDFWIERSLPEAEVRVAAYIGFCDFRRTLLKHPFPELPMQSSPRDDERWALSEVWADQGVLGSAGRGVEQEVPWYLAILPSATGNPQAFYRPRWSAGLVKGREPVRGLAEYKSAVGRQRSIMALVGGSLFRVEPRWVRDHPLFGEDDGSGGIYQWCLEFFDIPAHEAELTELEHTDGLRLSRRRDPWFNEGLRHPDGTGGAVVKMPASIATYDYFLFEAWVKLPDLEGKRTIASRTAVVNSGTGLYRKTNFHFYLLDGAPVLELEDEAGGDRYMITLASNDKARVRSLFEPAAEVWDIPGKGWSKVSVQINITSTGAFGTDHAFLINGYVFRAARILNEGTMIPSDIPDECDSTLIGVFGYSQDATKYADFRWSLGGRMAGFSLRRSDESFL
jgi:hypothetical protein